MMPGTEQLREWVEQSMVAQSETNGNGSVKTVTTTVKTYHTTELKSEVSTTNGILVAARESAQGLVEDIENQLEEKINGIKASSTNGNGKNWDEHTNAIQLRGEKPPLSEGAVLYWSDATAAEAWIAERKLTLAVEDQGKNEDSTQNLLAEHEGLEKEINDYVATIHQLGTRADQLMQDHPGSENIGVKQAQVDKMYAGLKDLAKERRSKLEDALKLHTFMRKVEDLKKWLDEREAQASSRELGKDYDHVKALVDDFQEFVEDTESIGEEKLTSVDKMADALMAAKHSEGATIAEWKETLNEKWADLLELIDSRTQSLVASRELHKFFADCKDLLRRISEKQKEIAVEVGRDAETVSVLQQRHVQFLQDVQALQTEVDQIKQGSTKQQAAHAGSKAREITSHESEIVTAWKSLEDLCEARKAKLVDTGDLIRFFDMARTLMLQMDDVTIQMYILDKSDEANGREALLQSYQSLKSELESQEENFSVCTLLSQELLDRKHFASVEVKYKLDALRNQRDGILLRLEERSNGNHVSEGTCSTVSTAGNVTSTEIVPVNTEEKPVELSLENVKKDVRSKSRFRSFRKQKPKHSTLEAKRTFSASDDELNIEKLKERREPSDNETLEAALVRKHEWESMVKKSPNRSWEKVYIVLRGGYLLFYKDKKSFALQSDAYFRGESPLALVRPFAEVASDYTKRKHVFRLKLGSGAEYLFQAKDDEEMTQWVGGIQRVAHREAKAAGQSRT